MRASRWPRRPLPASRGRRARRSRRAPNAATAARSASRTLIASISGGSPTALLPWTTPGSAARSRKRDAQIGRALAERRQLVGRGAVRQERAVRVPDQLLGREPADALHEAALDLAAIDQRRQRVADVVQDVDAQQPVLAGEAVDLDLAHRRAVGEVVERLALPRLPVEVDVGRPVEAGGEQRDALVVGLGRRPRRTAGPRRVGRAA